MGIIIQLEMKILSYTKLMSHPDKTLEEHLENVGNFSRNSIEKLSVENKDTLSNISFLIGISHDFAKSTSFFQKYLNDHKKNSNAYHSFLSAIFTYYAVNNYILSNNEDINEDLAIIAYIIVLKHHGNLDDVSRLANKHEEKIESKEILNQINDLKNNETTLESFYSNYGIDFKYFLDNFHEIAEDILDILDDFEDEEDIDNYFLIILLYSVLLDADKMDASNTSTVERKLINKDVVDNFKNDTFNNNLSEINLVRENAYDEAISNICEMGLDNKILSINLPTGAGKTLTGFSAAIKLKNRINKELGFNPRIIYSLPFLSIIDQSEEVIKSILTKEGLHGNNYLVKHNHLSDMSYEVEKEELDISNSKMLIEGWNSEIIITTFIQFFYSIFSNKNRSLRKYHNIVNSIIILDEIQSIPFKYHNIFNLFLKKLAEEYNCWIILMTATQPLLFKSDELFKLIKDPEIYFDKFDRINYNFNLNNQYLDDFTEELIERIESTDNDIMGVFNTINSSKEVYKNIKEYFEFFDEEVSLDSDTGICEIGDDTLLIYISTNIIPKNRLDKINEIKNSNKRKIIITTQLVEAGVDIDVDVIYRDFAPLDSIIQTAGRCNRNNGDSKGEVNVISLINEKGITFSSFVYDSLLLKLTKETIQDYTLISEREFNLKATEKYFSLVNDKRAQDKKLYKNLCRLNFSKIPDSVKLIEEKIEKVDVFVEVNNEAKELLNRFMNIKNNYYGFERKNEFLKIKSDFYKYVISIDKRQIGSTNYIEDENLFVVSKDDIGRKYDLDLGFIPEGDEKAFII